MCSDTHLIKVASPVAPCSTSVKTDAQPKSIGERHSCQAPCCREVCCSQTGSASDDIQRCPFQAVMSQQARTISRGHDLMSYEPKGEHHSTSSPEGLAARSQHLERCQAWRHCRAAHAALICNRSSHEAHHPREPAVAVDDEYHGSLAAPGPASSRWPCLRGCSWILQLDDNLRLFAKRSRLCNAYSGSPMHRIHSLQ